MVFSTNGYQSSASRLSDYVRTNVVTLGCILQLAYRPVKTPLLLCSQCRQTVRPKCTTFTPKADATILRFAYDGSRSPAGSKVARELGM